VGVEAPIREKRIVEEGLQVNLLLCVFIGYGPQIKGHLLPDDFAMLVNSRRGVEYLRALGKAEECADWVLGRGYAA